MNVFHLANVNLANQFQEGLLHETKMMEFGSEYVGAFSLKNCSMILS